MKYLPLILICFITGFSIESCVDHDIGKVVVNCDDSKTISFQADIKDKIIAVKCAIEGCHNGDNGDEINWEVLANFQDHAAEAKRRLTLSPLDPDKMPRTGSLTYEQIKTIVCWVEQGAKDN